MDGGGTVGEDRAGPGSCTCAREQSPEPNMRSRTCLGSTWAGPCGPEPPLTPPPPPGVRPETPPRPLAPGLARTCQHLQPRPECGQGPYGGVGIGTRPHVHIQQPGLPRPQRVEQAMRHHAGVGVGGPGQVRFVAKHEVRLVRGGGRKGEERVQGRKRGPPKGWRPTRPRRHGTGHTGLPGQTVTEPSPAPPPTPPQAFASLPTTPP